MKKTKQTAPSALLHKEPFSLFKMPGVKLFLLYAVFLGICIGFLVISSYFQEQKQHFSKSKEIPILLAIKKSLKTFELDDDLNAGLFRKTSRLSDTIPDSESALFALSVASFLGFSPQNLFLNSEKLSKYIAKQLPTVFSDETSLESLHIILQTSNLLSISYNDEDCVEKIYRHFTEKSGFKMNLKDEEGTVSGTYFAIQLLAPMKNQLNETVANKIRTSLFSHQAPFSGGFHDNLKNQEQQSQQPNLLITFRGLRTIQILNKLFPNHDFDNATSIAMNNAIHFLYLCHGIDGGFHSVPQLPSSPSFISPSTSTSTSQGLYIAAIVMNNGIKYSSGIIESAKDYLIACATKKFGVVSHATSLEASLEGSYYFSLLFKVLQLPLGNLSWLSSTANWIAVLFLCLALTVWFSPQMDKEILRIILLHSFELLVLLIGLVLILIYYPDYILLGLLAFLLVIVPLFSVSSLFVDQESNAVMFVEVFLFLGLVLGLQAGSSFIFVKPDIFLVLAIWNFCVTFICSYGCGFFIGKKSARFHSGVAEVAWGVCLIGLYLLLSARDLTLVYRLMTFRGQRVAIIVLLPIVYFALMQLGAALGNALYSGPTSSNFILKSMLNFTPKHKKH